MYNDLNWHTLGLQQYAKNVQFKFVNANVPRPFQSSIYSHSDIHGVPLQNNNDNKKKKRCKKIHSFLFIFVCMYYQYVCSTIYSNYLGHMVKGFNFVTDHSLPYSHSQSRIHKQQKAKRRRNITAIYDGLFIIV